MSIIIVKIKHQIIKDVLLDRDLGINIISSELYKKLIYNKIESISLIIKTTN